MAKEKPKLSVNAAGKRGGLARVAKMTPDQLKRWAKAASKKRWKKAREAKGQASQ